MDFTMKDRARKAKVKAELDAKNLEKRSPAIRPVSDEIEDSHWLRDSQDG